MSGGAYQTKHIGGADQSKHIRRNRSNKTYQAGHINQNKMQYRSQKKEATGKLFPGRQPPRSDKGRLGTAIFRYFFAE
jgi:hypothetical protein